MSRDLPAKVIVEIHATELGGPARIGTLRRVGSALRAASGGVPRSPDATLSVFLAGF